MANGDYFIPELIQFRKILIVETVNLYTAVEFTTKLGNFLPMILSLTSHNEQPKNDAKSDWKAIKTPKSGQREKEKQEK